MILLFSNHLLGLGFSLQVLVKKLQGLSQAFLQVAHGSLCEYLAFIHNILNICSWDS